MSRLLASYIEGCKCLPSNVHHQIVRFILAALDRPLKRENGELPWELETAKSMWFAVTECLTNEDDASLYEPCIKRIYSLGHEDHEDSFFPWCSNFWNSIGQKLPDTAAKYTKEFLSDVFDRKQTDLIGLLPVSKCKRAIPSISSIICDRLFTQNNQSYFMLDSKIW